MSGVLGKAEIQVLADADGLAPGLRRQLAPVGRVLEQTLNKSIEGAGREFDRLGQTARTALDNVDYGDVFDELADSADNAGDVIKRSLGDSAEQASKAVVDSFDGVAQRLGDQLDVGDQFNAITAELQSEARRLADRLESEFEGAGTRIESELRSIGDVDLGRELVNEASQTASRMVREFDGTGRQIAAEVAQGANFDDALVPEARKAADNVVEAFDGTGERIGNSISSGLEIGFGAAIGTKALQIGGALTAGLVSGINREQIVDKFASSLNLSGEQAAEFGATAGRLYSNAYGDSFEGVAETLRTALAVEIPQGQVETIVAQAESMGNAFDGAASEYITLANQFREQGITESVTEGLDLITTSFQQLPRELQQPLTEAVREYGTFLDGLGFSTEETFGLLTSVAEQGEFALDKTGDALKEFGIRATDLSTTSRAAFDTISLDAETMANKILAGGDVARGAFDEIVSGLLAIEDPAVQANTAIALFGTPLEDLSVEQIPQFLQSLQDMDAGMGDVEGAAARLDESINDNLATNLTTFQRTAGSVFRGIGDAIVAPLLTQVNPVLTDFADFLQEKGPGAAKAFSQAIEPLFSGLGDLIQDIDFGALFDSLSDIDLSDVFGDFDGEALADTFSKIAEAVAELIPNLVDLAGNIGAAGFSTFTALAPILADLAVAILPPLADSIGLVAEAFGLIAESVPAEVILAAVAAFKLLGPALKLTAAVKAAGSVKALITSLPIVTKATKAWAVAQKALNLAFLTSPIGLVIAGIAALGAAFFIAYQKSETFRDIVHSVLDALAPLVDIAKDVGAAFGDLFTGDFSGAFEGFKQAGADLLDFFGDLGSQIYDALVGAFPEVAPLLDRIVEHIQNVMDLFKDLGGVIVDVFTGDLSGALEGLGDVFGNLGPLFANWGALLGEALILGITGVLSLIGLDSWIEPIENALRGLGDFISEYAPKIFEGLVAAVEFVWPILVQIVETGVQLVGGVIGAAQALWDTGILQTAFDLLLTAVQAVWDVLPGIIEAGVNFVGEVIAGAQAVWDTGILQTAFDLVVGAIEVAWDLISAAVEAGVAFVGEVIAGAQAVWDTGVLQTVFDVVAAAFDTAWTVISTAVQTGVDVVTGIIDGISALWNIDGLSSVFDGVAAVIGAAWDAIQAVIQGAIDAISGIISGIASLWDADGIGSVFDGVAGAFGAAWDLATSAVDGAISAIGDIVSGIADLFNIDNITGIFDGLADAWGGALDLATGVVEGAVETIKGILGFFDDIGDKVSGFFGGIGDAVGGVLGLGGDGDGGGAAALAEGFALGEIDVGDIVGKVSAELDRVTAYVTEWGANLNASIQDALTTSMTFVVSWGNRLTGEIARGLLQSLTPVTGWGARLNAAVQAALAASIGFVVSWGNRMTGEMARGLLQSLTPVTGWGSRLSTAVSAALTGTLSTVTEWGARLSVLIQAALARSLASVAGWGIQLSALIQSALAGTEAAVTGWGSQLSALMSSALTRTLTTVAGWGTQLSAAVASTLDGTLATVAGWGIRLSTAVRGGLDASLAVANRWGAELTAAIQVGLTSTIQVVTRWAATFAQAVEASLGRSLRAVTGWGVEFAQTVARSLDRSLVAVTGWSTSLASVIGVGLGRIVRLVADWSAAFSESIRATLNRSTVATVAWTRSLQSLVRSGLGGILDVASGWGNQLVAAVRSAMAVSLAAFSAALGQMVRIARSQFALILAAVAASMTAIRTSVAQGAIAAGQVMVSTFTAAGAATVRAFRSMGAALIAVAGQIRTAIAAQFGSLRSFLSGFLNGVSLGSIDVSGALRSLDQVIAKANQVSASLRRIGASAATVRAPTTTYRAPTTTYRAPTTSTRSTAVPRYLAMGGIAAVPSIAGEDGAELVLPLTKPQRMRELLEEFAGVLGTSVGGMNKLAAALFDTPGLRSGAEVLASQRFRVQPPPGLVDSMTAAAIRPTTTVGVGQTSPSVRPPADSSQHIADAVEKGVRGALNEIVRTPRKATTNYNTIVVDPGRDLWQDMALIDQLT